ncbi:MAG: four helix bundle protein [Chloroflexi bacterium]|nr:four helix bundle protein [Chloroflexota bacterium]MCC6892356.1 four helix bundle protein [Anaerolineae bacterium]
MGEWRKSRGGNYQELGVWVKSHQLVLTVYKVTKAFPQEELYGLTSQIRRAALSIPTNIAEGSGRGGDKEFARFCQISYGSVNELEYHFLVAHDLNYIDPSTYRSLQQSLVEIRRMLAKLIATLQQKL